MKKINMFLLINLFEFFIYYSLYLFNSIKKNIQFFLDWVIESIFQLFNFFQEFDFPVISNGNGKGPDDKFLLKFFCYVIVPATVYIVSSYVFDLLLASPAVVEETTINAKILIKQHNLEVIHGTTVSGLHLHQFIKNGDLYLVGLARPIFSISENFICKNFFQDTYVTNYAYVCYVINVTKNPQIVKIILWTHPSFSWIFCLYDLHPFFNNSNDILNWFLNNALTDRNLVMQSVDISVNTFKSLCQEFCKDANITNRYFKVLYFKKWINFDDFLLLLIDYY